MYVDTSHHKPKCARWSCAPAKHVKINSAEYFHKAPKKNLRWGGDSEMSL